MSNVIWTEPLGIISGSTPFGYYDDDVTFQSDGKKVSKYCARQLGYPIVDLEITSGSIYSCFEQSVTKYSEIINEFRITENMLNLMGSPTSSNFTGKLLNDNIGQIIRLANDYGAEAGVGGFVTYKTGSIKIIEDQQVYNLNTLWADVSESGKQIEIKKIRHFQPPAFQRFFDPYVGTGISSIAARDEFGWDEISPAVDYVLMPLSEDALRLQAIEMSDVIRRSSYGFRLINNMLTLFPIPIKDTTLWFDYILVEDRDNPTTGMPTGVVSDMSNARFDNLKYANINSSGKNWISQYTLALSKQVLGIIRSKYSSIPIPDGEITLDGESLKSEGKEEANMLIEDLKEALEKTSTDSQLEAKKTRTENIKETLTGVPLGIYLG